MNAVNNMNTITSAMTCDKVYFAVGTASMDDIINAVVHHLRGLRGNPLDTTAHYAWFCINLYSSCQYPILCAYVCLTTMATILV